MGSPLRRKNCFSDEPLLRVVDQTRILLLGIVTTDDCRCRRNSVVDESVQSALIRRGSAAERRAEERGMEAPRASGGWLNHRWLKDWQGIVAQ